MPRFIEKQIPTLTSLLLHAVLLLLLWSQVSVQPREPESPKPIVMHVVPAPETPTPGRGPEMTAAIPEAQRTSANPAEQPTAEIPAVADGNEEPEKDPPEPPKEETQKENPTPSEPTLESPTPAEQKIAKTTLDPETLDQFRDQLQKTQQDLEARKSKVMTQIASIAPVEGPGIKRSYSSAGSDHGVIREIDISRYPREMQLRFMARYDIKIEKKMVKATSTRSYINAVVTDRGSYVNTGGPGYCEVMVLSKKTLARIAELEEQELRKRKMDPLRSRVLEVVFGLREDENGQVELVVTRFRAEAID